MTRITVVRILSLSYTGTTWLNVMLGCHSRAFDIGPADFLWNQRKDFSQACKIHGEECTFWQEFAKCYKPEVNLYLQLADFSGKDVFVINNPEASSSELDHPSIQVKTIVLFRDGRAVSASFHRKFPDKYPADNYLGTVTQWYLPATRFYLNMEEKWPSSLVVQYEDLVGNLDEHINRFSTFIGIDYSQDIGDFWKYPHHTAGGSGGPHFLISVFQGHGHPGQTTGDTFYSIYREEFEKLRHKQESQLKDERWKNELSSRDLYIFDHYCGASNAHLGYERNQFSSSEKEQCGKYVKELLSQHHDLCPRQVPKLVEEREQLMDPERTGGCKGVFDRIKNLFQL